MRINMEESLGQRCDLVKGASAETDIDSTNLERLEKSQNCTYRRSTWLWNTPGNIAESWGLRSRPSSMRKPKTGITHV